VVAVLISPKTIYWEVDVQRDFMLPGGKLYVPGAEKILPNINRLVEVVRQGRVFLISSADAHNPDDPELREWPPHCLKGDAGADLVPEASALNPLIIPNETKFTVPQNTSGYRQAILQKNTLDVFDNPHTDALLQRFSSAGSPAFDPDQEVVVFGVATEYCVQQAVEGLLRRGHRVAVVTDAVRSINPEKGRKVLASLRSNGARLITTDEALALVGVSP
jgi:nicotinamidase/pyrazinamidase